MQLNPSTRLVIITMRIMWERVAGELPAELGSVIYYNDNPDLRNAYQRRCMEESRLGIPCIFGYDMIHGFRTIYPISLGQACSWNVPSCGAYDIVCCRRGPCVWY